MTTTRNTCSVEKHKTATEKADDKKPKKRDALRLASGSFLSHFHSGKEKEKKALSLFPSTVHCGLSYFPPYRMTARSSGTRVLLPKQ
ncbi:hypothetical protein TNCT_129311 [Trichonephila clavata]|uniref:Uncharacterized protein n=1 Tax=Trichonephila clavata TaxID=2740835 RepID=A0A8X6LAR1_TRICU|nr:hypothetical protein TNCT_129311 [Trichonephila clavata]